MLALLKSQSQCISEYHAPHVGNNFLDSGMEITVLWAENNSLFLEAHGHRFWTVLVHSSTHHHNLHIWCSPMYHSLGHLLLENVYEDMICKRAFHCATVLVRVVLGPFAMQKVDIRRFFPVSASVWSSENVCKEHHL